MLARIGAYLLAISIVAWVRPSLPSLSEITCPTLTPLMRTSRLFGERERAREGDREAVALRLQRQRPAEGLPQEHQQPEAAEHEQDDHEDVAERGRALLHLSHPLPVALCALGPAEGVGGGRATEAGRGPRELGGSRRARSSCAGAGCARFAAAVALAVAGARAEIPWLSHSALVGGFSRPTSRFTSG